VGEKETEPFQFTFNGFLKVAFQGSRVTSDAGLILVRELDERLGLEAIIGKHLNDSRHGLNTQFPLRDLLRQSIYSRLAGYEDLNDAARLSTDPTFRLIGSPQRWDRSAALTSTLHWFETELLTREENLVGLMAVNRDVIGQAETMDRSDRTVLDMDSSESPVHGQQEGSAYNGHFESVCNHPLFLFNDWGDCLAAKLRPGNVPSADDWDELLVPEIERQQAEGKHVAVRADAAFAKPEIYEALEARTGERRHPLSPTRTSESQAPGAVQELRIPGGQLDDAPAGRRQGRAPCRRVVSARGIYRDEHDASESVSRPVLQPARHRGAMDQGRQASGALDPAVVPSIPGQRGALAAERPRLQFGESVAAVGVAHTARHMVAHQPAAALRQNGRALGEACPVLLAPVGREPPDTAPVRDHARAHLGVAGSDRLIRVRDQGQSGRRDGAIQEQCPRNAKDAMPPAAFQAAVSGFVMGNRCVEEFRLERSVASVACCQDSAAKSEMSDEIAAQIRVGGMGGIYRACEAKLDRSTNIVGSFGGSPAQPIQNDSIQMRREYRHAFRIQETVGEKVVTSIIPPSGYRNSAPAQPTILDGSRPRRSRTEQTLRGRTCDTDDGRFCKHAGYVDSGVPPAGIRGRCASIRFGLRSSGHQRLTLVVRGKRGRGCRQNCRFERSVGGNYSICRLWKRKCDRQG
jgi:Transposase DDE domain group 1